MLFILRTPEKVMIRLRFEKLKAESKIEPHYIFIDQNYQSY